MHGVYVHVHGVYVLIILSYSGASKKVRRAFSGRSNRKSLSSVRYGVYFKCNSTSVW